MDHLPTLVLGARDAIQAAQSVSALDELRVRYLGKKGEVTALLKGLGKLSAEERPAAGEQINQAKQTLSAEIDAKRQQLESEALNARLALCWKQTRCSWPKRGLTAIMDSTTFSIDAAKPDGTSAQSRHINGEGFH